MNVWLAQTIAKKLVLDWRKQQTTRAMVYVTIQDILNDLPRAYSKALYGRSAIRSTSILFMRIAGRAKACMR